MGGEIMGLFRKVIRISALDSPNVRMGLKEVEAGLEPSNTTICPGVLSWEEYVQRLNTWNEIRKHVGLYGLFWEGAEVMLFPSSWLRRAEEYADALRQKYRIGGFQSSGVVGALGLVRDEEDWRDPRSNTALKYDPYLTKRSQNDGKLLPRRAEGVGIDPAEGGDSTSMSAVDQFGLIEQVSKKTPNTNVIPREALAFARRHGLQDWSRMVFDTGGGGKQHADRLRDNGFKVRTVGFGESVNPELRRGGIKKLADRLDEKEERYEYVNRRAEMYGELRELLDPNRVDERTGKELYFGIPREYGELTRQLSLMPLLYDSEGRMKMLPKNKRSVKAEEKSLTEILGRSPDESDSLVLAVHGMLHASTKVRIGAVR
jgi:hypothetical protein